MEGVVVLDADRKAILEALLLDKPIPVAEPPVKHLPGQHDQSSHGSWSRGKRPEVPEAIKKFEKRYTDPDAVNKPNDEITHLRFESGCAVDANGTLIWEGGSNSTNSVEISVTVFRKAKDGIFSHNHPPDRGVVTETVTETEHGSSIEKKVHSEFDLMGTSLPPSVTDVATTVSFNLKELRVVGHRHGNPITFRIIRPEGGWPSQLTDQDYLHSVGKKVWAEQKNTHPGEYEKPEEGTYEFFDRIWNMIAEETGIIYSVEK